MVSGADKEINSRKEFIDYGVDLWYGIPIYRVVP